MGKRTLGLGLIALLAGCVETRQSDPQLVSQEKPLRPPPVVTYALCSDGLPTTGMWKCDPVFADVNEDGSLDMAALPRLGNGPHVWLGDGQGSWRESSAGLAVKDRSCGGGLSFGDVNGDGHVDLAVADHCQGIFVYLGDGAGHWNMSTEALNHYDMATVDTDEMPDVGMEDIALGDVNGDSYLDLVASASDQAGIHVYLGDGSGKSWKHQPGTLPTTGWANRIVLCDMNEDGRLDVVSSYSAGPRVWLNQGEGQWRAASAGLPSPLVHGLYTGIATGDVNEDGRTDIISANWVDGPEVYLQQENGSWKKTPDVFPEMTGGAVGLALGDLDHDGHLDMAVSGKLRYGQRGYVRGVFALRGNGAGEWTYIAHCGLPDTGLAATSGVALVDVDRDGLLDLAAASGLIVETAPGPQEPILPTRMLVWCAQRPSPGPVSHSP